MADKNFADAWLDAINQTAPRPAKPDFGIRCNVLLKTKVDSDSAGEVMLIKREHIYNIFDYELGGCSSVHVLPVLWRANGY